jgi:hypothetical protein
MRSCLRARFREKEAFTHIAAATVPRKAAPMVLPSVTGTPIENA